MTDAQAKLIEANVRERREHDQCDPEDIGRLIMVIIHLREREKIMLNAQRMQFVEAALSGSAGFHTADHSRALAANAVQIANITMRELGLDGEE